MIIKELSVAPIGTNCYILGCEATREAIVIDPGGSGQNYERHGSRSAGPKIHYQYPRPF